MPYMGTSPSSELANLDINGQKFILDADADTSITADTDDTIDIEIAGADDFQFTANTFTAKSGSTIAAQALTGTTGIFSSDVTGLTLNATGDTSASDNAALGYTAALGAILTGQGSTNDVTLVNDADATVLSIPTGTTNVSVVGQIISSDGTEAAPGISFSRDAGAGFFSAEGASGAGNNSVNITNDNDGTSGVLCFDNARLILNDATTINAFSHAGLTINQAGYDNEILAFKSSDIAHGMTDKAETDTYGALRKFGGAGGGFCIEGYTEDTAGFAVESGYVTGNTAKSSSGRAAIEMRGYLKSGTALGNTGANANMFMVNADGDVTGFLVDSDGDLHYDGSTSAFDEYDDALMLRTFQHEQTPDGIIKTNFDKFLKYNKKSLEESGIIGTIDPDNPEHYHKDGTLSRPLVCLTQLQRLEVGAIVQQRAMFETMKSVVEEMLPGFSEKLNERLEAQSLPALPV